MNDGEMIPFFFLIFIAAEPCRRRRVTMKPRTIYANRIAYLIATKRNTLKRLALMGAANTERRIKSANKLGGRKLQRSSVRITRKGSGKRAGRINVVSLVFFGSFLQ